MSVTDIIIVRIYLHEAKANLNELMSFLHDDSKVKGVTVFRGIAGFGSTGKIHSSKLLDMSLDLPIVVEFFDEPDKIHPILEQLKTTIKPGHMVHWPAKINL